MEPSATSLPLKAASIPLPQTAAALPRIESVDLLRGLVMALMALDHVRDFFSNAFFNPLDLDHTNAALFLTRWVTHFCAPVFVFLAGASAFLWASRGKTKRELARFLLLRGLFLVLLEFTLVHFGWFFSFEYRFLLAQVIWAIGWSMVALAGLIFLPVWMIAAFGLAMILGHNLLDGIPPDRFDSLAWLWTILHNGGPVELASGRELFVLYPLLPWIGVMAAGYAFGPLLLRERSERQRWLVRLGLGMVLAFSVLRLGNLYGDPQPWSSRPEAAFTILSFINTEKYPPSLLFILMTLGPSLLALALFDRPVGRLGHPFLIFGRVPLFYYVVHLALIHFIALALSYLRYGQAPWLFGTGWMFKAGLPDGYGYSLPVVYLIWLAVVVALYPVCRWYARLKQRRGGTLLSYL